MEAGTVQDITDVLRVFERILRDRHDHALTGRQPEGPLAREVLSKHPGHPLHAAQDGAMQDHWTLVARRQRGLGGSIGLRCRISRHHLLDGRSARLGLVAQVEAQRQLEVQLDCPTLMVASKCILQGDVDLRAVERSIALVESPLFPGRVQSLSQLLLGAVPELDAAEGLLWPRAQLQGKFEAEELVHVEDKAQGRRDLAADLVLAAEDVRVVLLEAAHTSESGERPAQLVAVQHTEGGQAQRQLSIGARLAVEDNAVPWAVHRLQEPFLALDLEAIHVLAVVLVVPRALEELRGVDVGRDDLVKATLAVLGTHELLELVVDPRTVAGPEAGARRDLRVEEEEVLLLADAAVIALLGLLEHLLVRLEQLRRREGHAIDALQRVVLSLAQPVGGRVLRDGEGLHAPHGGEVRSAAQVDEWAAAVGGRHGARRHLAADEVHFEWVAGEEFQGLLASEHEALERLIGLAECLDLLLDLGEVRVREAAVAQEDVVVEAAVDGRPNRQVTAKLLLERSPHDV
mmetsp:Transcript_63967/g.164651  ORF Transcript_63967/g.164651 Transcript_63967/m.164651 type:complete len:517 (-) Transcript_63967:590-2140(-)